MNAFDTVHLLVPKEGLIGYDTDSFRTIAELDADGNPIDTDQTQTLKARVEKPIGLSKVRILERGVDLEFSAKLLRNRYVDGISIETVGEIAPALRPILELDADALLQATLYRIDSTVNIRPKSVKRAILAVASLGSLNGRYRVSDYGGAGEQGFTFHSRAKSVDERFIGYDKEREMWRHKTQAYILGVENFGGVLRTESNIRHREQMRDFLGMVETYTFADALNSKKNPNLILFDRITENSIVTLAELHRINSTEGKGMEYFKNIGIDTVIELYGGNWKAIEKHVRLRYRGKSNPVEALRKVRVRVALYHSRQTEAEQLLDEVSEVRELLSKVA